MKDKYEYPQVDLYSIGREMMRASQFEEKYYEMEADRDYWRIKFQDLLGQSSEHNKEMLGNLLLLGLKVDDGK